MPEASRRSRSAVSEARFGVESDPMPGDLSRLFIISSSSCICVWVALTPLLPASLLPLLPVMVETFKLEEEERLSEACDEVSGMPR